MRVFQFVFVLILVVQQSYQDHSATQYRHRQDVEDISPYEESLKSGIYRLPSRSQSKEQYSEDHYRHFNQQRVDAHNPEDYRISETNNRESMKYSWEEPEDGFYNLGPDYEKQQEDKKRRVSVGSSVYTDNEDKKRSVSVKSASYMDDQEKDKKRSLSVGSKAYDGDYDNQQEEKKRGLSVLSKAYDTDYDNQQDDKKRSASAEYAGYDDERSGYKRQRDRINYGQEQPEYPKRRINYGSRTYNDQIHRRVQNWDEEDEQVDEYSHIKTRSLLPGYGPSANDEQQNTPLKQLVEKLQNHQSVPVTLREIHQIVREAQKQIWDQVVKMIPGGQLPQAMERAQKNNLFAGLAFNPFKQNVKGTNTNNGMPGANTIYPVPQVNIPGPLGKFFNPQQPKTNTESNQGGYFNPLGVFGSSN